jgi:hypothetical protein
MFFASLVAGVAVWLLFDALNTEPWDTPFGPAALLGLGFAFGYTAAGSRSCGRSASSLARRSQEW